MTSLEDDVPLLEELAAYRDQIRDLRQHGEQTLVAAIDSAPLTRRQRPGPPDGWNRSFSGPVTSAMLLRAVGRELSVPARTRLLAVVANHANSADEPSPARYLAAARALRALVGTPGHSFSEAAFRRYFGAVRHLYDVSKGHVLGAARANDTSAPSAFVTGEHVRALLALRRVLESTASLVRLVRGLGFESLARLRGSALRDWRRVESQRRLYSLLVSFEALRYRVILDLEPTLASTDLRQLQRSLARDLKAAGAAANRAAGAILGSRGSEAARSAARPRDADGRAEEAVRDARLRIADAAAALHNTARPDWERLQLVYTDGARAIAHVLRPSRQFLESVLDRELAAAAVDVRGVHWDAPELASAAAAYGALVDWNDPRLRRAASLLTDVLSDDGTFPSGRPFSHDPAGETIHQNGFELILTYANLVRGAAYPLHTSTLQRLLRYAQTTLRDVPQGARVAWGDRFGSAKRGAASPWVSACAIHALRSLERAIDADINRRVFAHFSVKRPEQLDLGLSDLIYSDFGAGQLPAPHGRPSVAFYLETMRGHVQRVARRPTVDAIGEHIGKECSDCISVVLHGPPGTGKTTLVESVAKSASVPLVQVAPPDITVGGVALERRARSVFAALSLLTDCVVVFDEFESVVWERRRDQPPPASGLEMLTAGMLPKLKHLRRSAKSQRVAYALITNLIDRIDNAAVREGRFDKVLGVYPPDRLSRLGTLELSLREAGLRSVVGDKGVAAAVNLTADRPMERLGRPGYLRVRSKGFRVDAWLGELERVRREAPFSEEASDAHEWALIRSQDGHGRPDASVEERCRVCRQAIGPQ